MHFLVFSQVKCLAWQVSFGQSGGSSLPSRQSGEKSQCFDIGMQFWPSAHLNQSGSWSSHCSICCWPSLFEAFEAKRKVDKTRIKNQQRVSWLSHIFVEFCRNFSVKSLFFYPGCVPWFLTHVFKLEKWFDDTVIISNFVVAGNNCGSSTLEKNVNVFVYLFEFPAAKFTSHDFVYVSVSKHLAAKLVLQWIFFFLWKLSFLLWNFSVKTHDLFNLGARLVGEQERRLGQRTKSRAGGSQRRQL